MMDLISNIEWGLKGLSDAANIHPLFVHFPIALLLTSFAAYILGSLFKKEELLITGKWFLYFGTLAAAVTVLTGLEAEKTVPHGGEVHEIMIGSSTGVRQLTLPSIVSLAKRNPNRTEP